MIAVATAPILYQYMAYGLSIDSSFPLPELFTREATGALKADVQVRASRIPRIPRDAIELKEGHWARGEEVWLCYDGVCRMYIHDGQEIVVEGANAADDRVLRVFVLGVGLGVLLHQRGFLSLHASAAVVNNAAVAFLGRPGSGKSTMTAVLAQRGHAVVADDVVAVDLSDPLRPTVAAGFPQLKLTPQSAGALGHDLSLLKRIHEMHPKYSFPVMEGMADDRILLKCVYVLGVDDQVGIDVLKPQFSLIELVRHTYTAGLLEPTGVLRRHMEQCAALISSVRMRCLKRPFDLTALHNVAALVEQDCLEQNMDSLPGRNNNGR